MVDCCISEIDFFALSKKCLKILRKNYSCPGIDGITYKNIKSDFYTHRNKIWAIIESLLKNETVTVPRIVEIIDAFKKNRKIYVYNIYERIIQIYVKLKIEKLVRNHISDCVISHRRGINISDRYSNFLEINRDLKILLKIDVRDYYISICKNKLYKLLISIGVCVNTINAVQLLLKHCEYGIPAGNCLSPLLSDFYLTKFDEKVDVPYLRYNDDMYFLLDNLENTRGYLSRISDELSEINLKLNEKKISIIVNPTLANFI